jgi:signal transduction histidine kinase
VYQITFHQSFIILTCLWFSALLANAQQPSRIDSLHDRLDEATGKDRYEVLFELAREYFYSDYEASVKYSQQAREIALTTGDSLGIVSTGRILGQLYNRKSRNTEALEILLPSLRIAQRNRYREEQKKILNNLAVAYTIQAAYDKALDYHFKTLVMREEDGNKEEVGVTRNNIGLVYFKLRNYPKALEFYIQALQLLDEASNKPFIDRQLILINIGLCHNQLKNYSEGLKYFKQAFESCGNGCSDQVISSGNFGLGVAHFGAGTYDDARKYFTASLEKARATLNTRFEAENLVYLGKVAIAQNRVNEAEDFLAEAETIARANGYNELLIDAYRQFSILYDQVNDYENAADFQRKYIVLKDSVYSEQLIDKLAELQTNFAERQNLAIIAAKEEVITRQRMLNLSIGIIAILASLLVFVLYRSNRTVRRVNKALSEAKTELQKLNDELDKKVKEKTASLQKVNEELDNFIYKTSHDIRGPLASLKGICNLALMEVSDPLSLDYLKKLDETADKLNKILTRLLIVNRVNNATLVFEPVNLGEMIDEIIMTESKRGLPPRFIIKKEVDKALSFNTDRELIRIILENLIDNAIKFHNDSDRIDPFARVKIDQTNGSLEVYVIDNGLGVSQVDPVKIFQMFSRASERSGTGGIGLYLTKLATERLGGIISLGVTSEGYTEFKVTLPAGQA